MRGPGVVGFRWTILTDQIPEFVERFYATHLGKGHAIPRAFQKACAHTAQLEDTVWESAVALAAE
jgi:hypothetical protein